ncbi:MAG: Hsp33 family molecular chaperone [Pseudomonadota bacterium]
MTTIHFKGGASGAVDLSAVAPAGKDAVLPFAVETLDTRGRALHMGPALNEILSSHAYPAPVSRLLGEMLVLTALLGTSLKFDGRFILQAQTDGPVNLLVVDFQTPSNLRAYARFDDAAVEKAEREGRTRPEDLLGKGVLAMTVDQGQHMQRYQGMVPLEGASLEEVAHAYFVQSEQIPTRVRLGVSELVSPGDDGAPLSTWQAGGVLVQFLPESEERVKIRDLPGGDGDDRAFDHEEDNAWTEAQALLSTVSDEELTDPDIPVETLLFRLFHEQGLRLFSPQKIAAHCSCSGETIWAVLKGMSDDELHDIAKDGKIEVKCEFCAKDYSVTAEEIIANR